MCAMIAPAMIHRMARTETPAPEALKLDRQRGSSCGDDGETRGTSSGLNIEPGSNDDGWEVPPPVRLQDGTRVQLYKDGEALHAAYEAIKYAKRRICLESYI